MKLLARVLSALFLMAAGMAMLYGQQAVVGKPAATTDQLPKDINPIPRNRVPPINPAGQVSTLPAP